MSGKAGGYLEKQYTGLPDHNKIAFNFQFFPLDSWDGGSDNFKLSFDGTELTGISIDTEAYSILSSRCGDPDRDDFPVISVHASVPHIGDALTLRITSLLDNDSQNESMGFRQIIMAFLNEENPYPGLCGVCDISLPSDWCGCADGTYQNPQNSGKCSNCDETCATCSGSDSDDCLTCPYGGSLNSDGTCPICTSPCSACSDDDPTECFDCIDDYFLVGNTCYPTCNYPLEASEDDDIDICTSPCPDSYTLWDQSCADDCNFPLEPDTSNSFDICKFPCEEDEFLYWDGNCRSVCPSPLVRFSTKGRKFCKNPCEDSEVLYWNGDCADDCVSPYEIKTISDYEYCASPCTGSKFLYNNGSCKSTCGQSYYASLDHGSYLCNFYCDSDSYYLTAIRSCLSSCPSGYFEYPQDRVCLACKDPLCGQCPLNHGITCNVCKEGAILDSDGVCKQCESLKAQYIKPIGSSSHEYLITLSPDSCDLTASLVKSSLLPTLEAKKNFPPFTFQTSKTNPHTYQLRVTFNASVLEPANLGITLSYLSGSLAVPKTLIASSLAQAFQDAAPTMTSALTSTMGTSLGGTLAIGASAAMWPMISFQQFIGYFIYLNIDYPPQLEIFLSLFSFTDWDFLPNPIASLTEQWKEDLSLDLTAVQDGESKYQLPPKFVKYEIPTFFIDNGGSLISMNILLIIMPLFLRYIRRVKILKIDRFLWKIEMNLRWNGVFRAFLENSIPLLLATIIQLKKFTFDNIYTTISTLLAVASFFYILLMLHFVWFSLQSRSRYRLELPLVRIVYGTLYEGLDLKDYSAKYYHLFIMLRGFLLIFLTVFMDVQPLLQVVPLIIYNIGLLYFLFQKKIFLDSKLNLINKIKEFLIIIGECFMLCLCFQSDSEDYYQVLGWMVVGTLGSAALLELVYLVAIQIIEFRQAIKKFKLLLFANKDAKSKKELEKVNEILELKHKSVKMRENSNNDTMEFIDLQSQLAALSNEIETRSYGF